jgi:hypothetical protein
LIQDYRLLSPVNKKLLRALSEVVINQQMAVTKKSLHRPQAEGHMAHLGQAEISVRATEGKRITQVSIRMS